MCACNCLDEIRDGKIHGINSDMYNCISNRGDLLFEKPGLEESYICTACGPTYLPLLKARKTNDSQMGSETKSENENARDNLKQQLILDILCQLFLRHLLALIIAIAMTAKN